MKKLIAYRIPFKGLATGEHDYRFHITEEFFEAMQSNESYPCDIDVELTLDREPSMMVLDFRMKGHLDFACDVCLDKFRHPFEAHHQVVVKLAEKESEDDDLIYLHPGEHRIDVSGIILEDIILNLPLRKVHPLDEHGHSTCNAKQVEMLRSYEKGKGTDRRWDALKNIQFEE